jgi:CheY-like chemotaxis protein
VQQPEGKKLTIRTGFRERQAFIEIEDNGTGIAPEIRETIFQPFFTTKEPGRGTGLGLPICRQIAQEHGGDISVRGGGAGRGSVFCLDLPLGSAEDFDRIGTLEAPAPLSAVPGKRVLVADDEEDIADVIARLLREDGDTVEIAHNGEEAVKLLAAASYDLVVSDIEMEHTKGTDLYAALAAQGAFPATKILFVTGDILNPKVLEFLSRTKSEYAVKPFDIQELRQTMRKLLAA